jgi:calcineurin-like phosphoesterase family protein
MDYFIGDPHFWHKNILKYEPSRERLGLTIEEMNEELIKRINQVISRRDRLYILGDFCFAPKWQCREILNKIHGTKVLIMGNHDKGRSPQFFTDIGFKWASPLPVIYNTKYILSHEPFHSNEFINIHAHMHSKGLITDSSFCASIECTDFKPVSMAFILKQMLNNNLTII